MHVAHCFAGQSSFYWWLMQSINSSATPPFTFSYFLVGLHHLLGQKLLSDFRVPKIYCIALLLGCSSPCKCIIKKHPVIVSSDFHSERALTCKNLLLVVDIASSLLVEVDAVPHEQRTRKSRCTQDQEARTHHLLVDRCT